MPAVAAITKTPRKINNFITTEALSGLPLEKNKNNIEDIQYASCWRLLQDQSEGIDSDNIITIWVAEFQIPKHL